MHTHTYIYTYKMKADALLFPIDVAKNLYAGKMKFKKVYLEQTVFLFFGGGGTGREGRAEGLGVGCGFSFKENEEKHYSAFSKKLI